MTTPNNTLKLAKIFQGYKEHKNKHNLFGMWYGWDNEPWCGMFVSAMLNWTGVPLEIESSKGYAYVPTAVNYFMQLRKLKESNPLPGDIVFYDWNRDGTSDHTGLILDSDNTSIQAIEGNTSDGNPSDGGTVQIKARSKLFVLGYATPNYSHQDNLNGSLAVGVPNGPSHPISVNDRSPFLINWRVQMKKRGYAISLEKAEIFKESDKNTLIEFQDEKGLLPDGILGPQSWLATWLMPIT